MKATRFPSTRWSLIGRATTADDATRLKAVAEFFAAYQPALRGYLNNGRGLSSDAADDVVQDFIAEKVLARNILAVADQGRGRLRNLLMTSLTRFAVSKARHGQALRSRTVEIEHAIDVPEADDFRMDSFDREWAAQVLALALKSMERECRDEDRADLWEIFQLRIVEPAQRDEQIGLGSPRKAINLLASARRIYARHFRAAVRQYVRREEDVDREIAALREIVGRWWQHRRTGRVAGVGANERRRTSMPSGSRRSVDRPELALLAVAADTTTAWSPADLRALLQHQLDAALVEVLSAVAVGQLGCRCRTFRDLLSCRKPSPTLLRALKRFCKARMRGGGDALPKDIGRYLYVMALLRARATGLARFSRLDDASLLRAASRCFAAGWAPAEAHALLRASLGEAGLGQIGLNSGSAPR